MLSAQDKTNFLLQFRDSAELARAAAERFATAVRDGRARCVALSGGRIARAFYDEIVKNSTISGEAIHGAHFFFADERCVPPSDPESNFAVARQALFDPLQIRADQIHRIHGETDDAYAVQEAEAELCRVATLDPDGQPILDLVILGMGEDGHTASLFPGEPASLMENADVYRAVTAVKPPPRRITLGYAPLKVAREIWVLASGVGKEPALRAVLQKAGDPLPLRRVLESQHNFLIFSDIPGSESMPKNFERIRSSPYPN